MSGRTDTEIRRCLWREWIPLTIFLNVRENAPDEPDRRVDLYAFNPYLESAHTYDCAL